jgi:hypothetical protein
MTLDIQVQSDGAGEFTVKVDDGTEVTELSVIASDRFLAELDVPDAPVEEVVREAVVIVLDRRLGTAGAEIDLEYLAGDDEDFAAEVQSRLGF